MIYTLSTIDLDERALDGTWCRLPYPNHKNGCPNYGHKKGCPPTTKRFDELVGFPYYLVIQQFDLKTQEERMLTRHPNWSIRQARCCLYWQRGLFNRVLKEANEFICNIKDELYYIVENPEGVGVDLFTTCRRVGIYLQRDYRTQQHVWKMVIIGIKKEEN